MLRRLLLFLFSEQAAQRVHGRSGIAGRILSSRQSSQSAAQAALQLTPHHALHIGHEFRIGSGALNEEGNAAAFAAQARQSE